MKPPLHLLTCGSVDDGKSTLIGRLLYDSKKIYRDQLERLENDSKRFGTQGDDLDFALLVDGLSAEREQGITIDVAYRFFSTEARDFIIADCPGHEQYTRNMATGASHSNCALILVDALRGVSKQTKRHAFISSLLGIRDLVVVVNKMDLVGYQEQMFVAIKSEIVDFLAELSDKLRITCVPISALRGDNVVTLSASMPWYAGQTLLQMLETVDVSEAEEQPWAFPVQWVNRPNATFRGYAGTVFGNGLQVGSQVLILPSKLQTKVKSMVSLDGDLEVAENGQAVTICLEDECDISRGDVLTHPETDLQVSDQLQATVIWMGQEPLHSGRSYLVKTQCGWNRAVVTKIKYLINVENFAQEAANQIEMNQIAVITLALDHAIVFKPYESNRIMGSMIVVDKLTNQTMGAALITFGLRRASNVQWQTLDVNKTVRSEIKHQRPCVLWFTGLSGSGKSTVANLVEKALLARARHTYLLDGDNVRHGLCQDLGFTTADRVENIRRVGEVSKLMVDAGLIVLTSFISPFQSEREMVRRMLGEMEFIEIFVDAPLEVCEQRDVKGLYAKARSGLIKNFTGFDSPYETPTHPELILKTDREDPSQSAEKVMAYLEKLGFLNAD